MNSPSQVCHQYGVLIDSVHYVLIVTIVLWYDLKQWIILKLKVDYLLENLKSIIINK